MISFAMLGWIILGVLTLAAVISGTFMEDPYKKGLREGKEKAEKEERERAIKAGTAEYQLNKRTGNVEFKYINGR